jgi:glycosyltransferase involved in cell wall biosynthesis
MPLRIAAKVDSADRSYYHNEIEPLLRRDRSHVDFVGEIGENAKGEFLGNAAALLFPIDWPEPFGLVMIEALACGTPVIAFRNGSVPEIVDDGVTGLIVESTDQAVLAVERIGRLDRMACRLAFERRFSVGRMADDYLAIYSRIVEGESATVSDPASLPRDPRSTARRAQTTAERL